VDALETFRIGVVSNIAGSDCRLHLALSGCQPFVVLELTNIWHSNWMFLACEILQGAIIAELVLEHVAAPIYHISPLTPADA
jgi:hypothetical protein